MDVDVQARGAAVGKSAALSLGGDDERLDCEVTGVPSKKIL